MSEGDISQEEVDALYGRLVKDAGASGYCLNRDVEFAKELVRSLLLNDRRYGYFACPCRLATGSKEEDLDIICPCDYRDMDVSEFAACYCALYISQSAHKGEKAVTSIPERRLPPEERKRERQNEQGSMGSLPLPVWRCKVCGYLCAREAPPDICPICKAKGERFERFI
jgi:ferredoxin-thioredoxin reductase catalytic subunit